MPVIIAQALCPSRHCILACAQEGEPAELEFMLRTMIEMLVARNDLNAHCGLCGAPKRTWTYEVGITKYATQEEALPEIQRLEAEQLELRRQMFTSGRAFDVLHGTGKL
jgi:hypothetical protein